MLSLQRYLWQARKDADFMHLSGIARMVYLVMPGLKQKQSFCELCREAPAAFAAASED